MAGHSEAARRTSTSLVLRSVERDVERRRLMAEDEVRRLIEACFELVQKSGQLEPRVGEIVNAAGLSNQAFYRYFRSKDELLLAVLDEGVATLASYLEHRMSQSRTPERRIRQWLSGLLEQALNPKSAAATRPFALSRGRLLELFPEDVNRSEMQLTGILQEAIADAVAQGVFPDASPKRDAELIYDLAMGWVERQLASVPRPKRSEANDLIAFAIRGLEGDRSS